MVLRHRPRRFTEIIGQEAVVRSLRGDIAKGLHRGQAYFLNGPSGSGKTTLAHVISRAANCKAPTNGDACGDCEPCRSETTPGLIRMDAADERGLNDIRAMRSRLGYVSMFSRHRIILLDEAHGLTNEAREALLGILEEARSDLTFILCTTDPESKFADTLLSRCSRHSLRPVPAQTIADRLADIAAEREYEPILPDAFLRLARLSRGNVRDALGNLDSFITTVTVDGLWTAEDEAQALKELERTRLPAADAPARARYLTRGRPSKGAERREIIRRLIRDGDWHHWSEITTAAKRRGMHDMEAIRATRRQLENEGLIEVTETGRAVMIRRRDETV